MGSAPRCGTRHRTAAACAGSSDTPNRLYSGMPSQDAQPDTTQYAYPAYWAANFTRRAVPRPRLQRCAC